MLIGIDASRAFLKNRTGIEEYSYQIIKHLRNQLTDNRVVLYLRKGQTIDFDLPKTWEIKIIKWSRFWTQLGLSLEMLKCPVDALLVPAHTVPFIHPARNATPLFNNGVVWWIRKLFNSNEDWDYAHSVAGGPKNTIVVVHGLEYEFCPEAYSGGARLYMRWTIRKSCKWASKIISVSENTKKDLVDLYNVQSDKIRVIYEGYAENFKLQKPNSKQIPNDQIPKENLKDNLNSFDTKYKIQNTRYILFIGRIEQRKNITNIIKAFEILKEKYDIPQNLVLAGKPGFGYEKIKSQIINSKFENQIKELGFVTEEEKWTLLKNADAFVFPTLYEGFGIPILEAQSVGCPVVASDNSSIPEVVSDSALLVDPMSCEEIATKIHTLLSDYSFKNAIIQKGLENVKRFSWEKCAREIANEITK